MFLIFDTETTGLPKRDNAPVSEVDNWPRVVQIAWQLHDETGELKGNHNVLIRPDGFEIPYSAEKVHGISTTKAKTEGIPLEEALSIFNKSLEQTRVLVGHNIRFDMNALGAEFIRSGIETSFLELKQVCTMRSTTDHLKLLGGRGGKFKPPKLMELYEFLFKEQFSEAHNAAADVEATTRCFLELLRLKVITPESMNLAPEQYSAFIAKNPGRVKQFGLSHVSNREEPASIPQEEPEKGTASESVPEPIDATAGAEALTEEDVEFCHLHVHTQYSILDGAASIPNLLKKAIDDGMRAVAITDHGNMFGVKEFHNEATKRGIKPILGCEAYIARRSRLSREDKNLDAFDHVVLLAKNKEGYKNLTTMVSLSWTEGFYYKPRIDREILEKYSDGVICLSACLGGEIPQAIMHRSVDDAEKVIFEYKRIFGEDFYLEMQRHQSNDPDMNKMVFNDQVFVNRTLFQLGQKHGVKCVASNDVHFVDMDDAEAHDHLICLNTGRDLDDPKRMRYTRQEWFKTQAEMREVFSDHPEILKNTMEVAEKVETFELNSDPIMPFYPLPEGFDNEDAYLNHLTYEGAKLRYETITDDIRERIDFELGTIQRMGFPGYFLIVQDFISAAREMGVSVGPGRGSAAGSAVAYCLKITDIDPIRYDLLFERFLNPDRISMPDIDIDFDEDGREEVLKWVVTKYGHKRVAHIITFGTMAAKMAIRDVARIQKLPLPEADRLAKLVPERPGTTFKKAYEEVPELNAERSSNNPLVSNTLRIAERLEGSVRQTGLHACGVIIGRNDLTQHLPVCKFKDSNLLVTQFDGHFVEDVGMLKMDFLGLKTLSIIKDAIVNVKDSKGIEVDIDHVPMDDIPTFELYSRGDTTGLFQFESPGMKKYLKDLKPNRFEDLIAMNALYRPGPMEYIPSFINRKHGKEKIEYDQPEMEEYLKDTYGITVYQEQVMLLSRKLAGFTRGEADSLRKAMGKKIKKMMDELKVKFEEGCLKNGIPKNKIDKIWTDWEAFAQYAFNKSHSTCYAYVSYQTGYLKANFPAEFMAAVLSRNITDIKKIGVFMDECRRMGIQVLGPDVNESNVRFTVNENGDIRFGLGAIKGVGANAVQSIIEERAKQGPFRDIYDFVERNDLHQVNRKNLEGLVISGALDCFKNIARSQYIDTVEVEESSFIEQLIKYGNKIQYERDTPQQNLFGETGGITISKPEPANLGEWDDSTKCKREKELIGIYLTSHPLDRFKLEIDSFCPNTLHQLHDLAPYRGRDMVFCGMVKSVRDGVDQWKNKPYLLAQMEDYTDTFNIRLKNDDYVNFKQYFSPDVALMIRATVNEWSPREEPQKKIYSLRIKMIYMLADVREKLVKSVDLIMDINRINPKLMDELEQFTVSEQGKMLKFRVHDPESQMKLNLFSRKKQVLLTDEFIKYLKEGRDFDFRLA
ncbi:MAG: DNA polymerase III subunit alpha [Bacteroidetes bacterium]|nr:DNA polymerase III subunit alpha [Bacteroidota bacterium]